MSWLDLHMHSEVSLDGEYSPKQLAGLCHEKGLKVAALSDHNSVRGVEEMMVSCARFGIRGIPAVELDCTFDGVDLHLLGYGIPMSIFSGISVPRGSRPISRQIILLLRKRSS